MIPPNPNPWRHVEHEGEAYLVRFCDGVCWLNRISDRACWLFDPADEAPTWAKTSSTPTQADLF